MKNYKIIGGLTAIYDRVPTKLFAILSINIPDTPKSHNFISPRPFTRIFDGFTSRTSIFNFEEERNKIIRNSNFIV